MENYEALVTECDSAIRRGEIKSAVRALRALNIRKIPRSWLLPLARIARRAGQLPLGLRMLEPTVNSEVVVATTAERAEHAVLLLRTGATAESVKRLRALNAEDHPDVLLYQAFACLGHWDFAGAIPLLEAYLEIQTSPYWLLVGKANLALAHVESRNHAVAEPLVRDLIHLTSSQTHRQLEANCRTLLAQIHSFRGEFAAASESLNAALTLFDSTHDSNDTSLVRKWLLIVEALRNGDRGPLRELRRTALANRDWEAVREADFHDLQIQFDMERFAHLYFGSPFPALRARLDREIRTPGDRKAYILGRKRDPRFDSRVGEFDGRRVTRPSGMVNRTVAALLSDLYRPACVGSLFSQLFPEETFSISSSPNRVHQIVRRTRLWMKNCAIPARLEETDGFFHLTPGEGVSFLVPLEFPNLESHQMQFDRLSQVVSPDEIFSSAHVSERLGLSLSTVHRMMNWAREKNKVIRLGSKTRDARYRIMKQAS